MHNGSFELRARWRTTLGAVGRRNDFCEKSLLFLRGRSGEGDFEVAFLVWNGIFHGVFFCFLNRLFNKYQ